MELFGLNPKIGSTKAQTLSDISEEGLKTNFQEICKTFGNTWIFKLIINMEEVTHSYSNYF